MTEQWPRGTTAAAVEEERASESGHTRAATSHEQRTATRGGDEGQTRPTTAAATAFNTTTYRYHYGTIPSIPVINRAGRGIGLVPLLSSQGVAA